MLRLEARSEEEQEAIARHLAQLLPKGVLIYLQGDLGAGKTTFARGFLRGLGHQGPVKSPTYTLIEPYEIGDRDCFHLDLYRLGDPDELEYLGIRDLLQRDAVLLVEWPEQGGGALPTPDLLIRITYINEGRELNLEAGSPVLKKLLLTLKGQLPDNVKI